MFRRFLHRFRALFRKGRLEREMEAEMRFHLEMEAGKNIRRGMSEKEARQAALRSFGGVAQMKEVYRDLSRFRRVEDVFQDLRYGARMLVKHPGFTLIVMLTLALGIGANTAVFSVVDAFMLRLLPVKEPQQLVFVRATLPNGGSADGFTYSTFEQIRNQNQSFSGIVAYDGTRLSVRVEGQAEMVLGDFVSGDYFDVLGVRAILGRTFTVDDDRSGKAPVAVISHGCWERLFGGEAAAIGKTIYVGKLPVTVIGITSPQFHGRKLAGRAADVVLPMSLQPQLRIRDHDRFEILARLKSDVRPEEARGETDVIYHRALMQEAGSQLSPETEQKIRAQRIELRPGLRGTSVIGPNDTTQVRIVMGIVTLVLLIACVNVANLLLARASVRQKEVAVRLSLGANRGRVIRQLLTESVLLAMLGGVLGLLFATWGVEIILKALPFDAEFALRVDARILGFTAALSLLTGILFGIIPAFSATRIDLNQMMKGADGGAEARPRRQRLMKSLVIAQVALSLSLLIGAGLLIRSLQQIYAVDTGYDRDRILTMGVYPSLLGYDHPGEMRLYSDLLAKLKTVPGVQSASLSRYGMYRGPFNIVGPRFFETLGIKVLQGREFTETDTATSPKVALINETTARRYFSDQSPLGQPLTEEIRKELRFRDDALIVGVVKNFRRHLRQEQPDDGLFIPHTQVSPEELGQAEFFIRAAGNPAAHISVVRRQIQAVEKDLALRDFRTMTEELEEAVTGEHSLALLLGFFGSLALALAAIGLYGTISYAVNRRTKELGIRIALGAQKRDLLRMVLGEALVQVAVGVIIGVPVAMGAMRLISSMLFGVQATDWITISAAVIVMLAVACAAAYPPARRATKVDPIAALKYE